jgi:ATP-binding cassette subfamily B protein
MTANATATIPTALATKTSLEQAISSLRHVIIYLLLFSFAINFLTLMLPIYTLQVFDRVFTTRNYDTLIGLTALTIFALSFFGVLHAIRAAVIAKTIEWLDKYVAVDVLGRAIHAASIDTRITAGQPLRELTTLKNFIATSAPTIFDAPWSVLFVLVIYLIHPLIGMLAFIGMIIFVGAAFLNEYSTRKLLKQANLQMTQSQLGADLLSANAQSIQAMGMQKNVVESWIKTHGQSIKAQETAQRRSAILQGITRSARMVLQISVTGFGAFLVMQGELTPGGLIASSILMARVLAPFEGLIGLWKQFIAARESYARIHQLLSAGPPAHGTTRLPAPEGALEAESLFYAPPGKPAILRGISFKIPPGESLGVIGPSGAGKSTLAKCLVGVYPPNHGNVRLDGSDVYQWEREDFGQHVGYLPQQVELFVGSLKQNIGRMSPEIDDESVILAAKRSGVHALILQLPNGYDTMYYPGAGLLSPGQLQRVGLARALYGKPRLLVLDEPNNNLDGDGERALTHVLNMLKRAKITTIVVAHRPSILATVDHILALKNGMMDAFDSRENMLLRYTAQKAESEKTPKENPAQITEKSEGKDHG